MNTSEASSGQHPGAASLPPAVSIGETDPLENDFQAPVCGENNYDDGALHPTQVAALQRHLAALRRENEAYLAHHDDLKQLLGDFIATIVDQQPDVARDFAAQYFSEVNRKRKENTEKANGQSMKK